MHRQKLAEQLGGDARHCSRLKQEQCLNDNGRHAEFLDTKAIAVNATKNTGNHSEERVSGRNWHVANAG